MIKVITTGRHPIKLWLDDIEPDALEQAQNLANLPFVHSHVAIMPDAHSGFGMPIGGVLAADGVVIPNAVGVDIGCGMCAVPVFTKQATTGQLKDILAHVRRLIPVGFNKHERPQDEGFMPQWAKLPPIVASQYDNARHQIGTLGGGNHFIEIQQGSDGFLWIMIHSGSRNIGKQVADHYNKIAKELNKRWRSEVPSRFDLAFLPLDTVQAQSYLDEMNYCVEFALANRSLMMRRVKEAVDEVIGGVGYGEVVNIAHNYAASEFHFGREVMVHRKGATRARVGEKGIIPGSMGTKSFIVSGLGNKDSFESCSHGAGRVMGRRQAQRTLDLAGQVKQLDDLGVLHGMRHKHDLEEAPAAYKDIDVVMQNQKDLVEVLVELKPLAVVKG